MKTKTNLDIQQVDINSPTLDPANARTGHDINGLAQSLDRYGLRKPIVVNKRTNIVLAGNCTLKAARRLGLQTIVVNYVDDDPQTAVGYALADNRLTDLSEFDDEALLLSLQQFDSMDDVIGFEQADYDELLAELGVDLDEDLIEDSPPPIDKADELQAVWQVETGDLWALGRHRLLCGDCTVKADVDRLMGGNSANVVFTSPPYAMQRKDTYGGVETDKYVEWWDGVQSIVRDVLADDGSFFVNIKPHCKDGQRVLYVFDLVLAMVRQWGWRFVDELCWCRASIPGLFGYRFKNGFEPIYHFSLNNRLKFNPKNVLKEFVSNPNNLTIYDDLDDVVTLGSNYKGDSPKQRVKSKNHDGAMPSNVLKINTGAGSGSTGSHGAAFPIKLPTFFIKAYSDPDDIILDPFMGSGTTLIAAHNEDRIGYGTERLPKYCSVILQRYADLTNETPEKLS